jgi:hypothetical protein
MAEKPDGKLVFIVALIGGVIIAGASYQVIHSFKPNPDPQCLAALVVTSDNWWEQSPEPECTPNFVDNKH